MQQVLQNIPNSTLFKSNKFCTNQLHQNPRGLFLWHEASQIFKFHPTVTNASPSKHSKATAGAGSEWGWRKHQQANGQAAACSAQCKRALPGQELLQGGEKPSPGCCDATNIHRAEVCLKQHKATQKSKTKVSWSFKENGRKSKTCCCKPGCGQTHACLQGTP